MSGAGRYAPSPSGDLHLGNLRTGLLAWLFARSTGRDFLIRVEDLDRVRPGSEARQLADLAAIGIEWDGPVVRQSERTRLYDAVLARLQAAGHVYECYCSRREIQEAASAPHGTPGLYPGTCRDLSSAEAETRRAMRPPALRLRAEVGEWTVRDMFHGDYRGPVDDVVLRRTDGVFAYNLTVVVDDADQGIDQVVRGDDLLSSSPRQAYLAQVLGLSVPTYAHVPLAVNAAGARLSKRDGAVTLADFEALGVGPHEVRDRIARSLGLGPGTPAELLERFGPTALSRSPWVVDPWVPSAD